MIGEKLGNYTILEIVGNGSMGTVFKAEDPGGQPVALKLVSSRILDDMQKRERFLQHALAASEIRNEKVCPILEIGDDHDDLFIITPFIEGKTLDKHAGGKALLWEQAIDVAMQTGAALEAIHAAGTVHRGLNPANIWILNNRDHSVLISDTCLAPFTEIMERKKTRSSCLRLNLSDTFISLDSLSYMSPEQVRGDFLDCRTDIFSFGIVLYEMLSGCHPFEAGSMLSRMVAILELEPPPLGSRQAGIPFGFESIVQKALAKSCEKRYQNMRALLTDLHEVHSDSLAQNARERIHSGIRRWLATKLRRGRNL
jgi:serine/threonine protein kinase